MMKGYIIRGVDKDGNVFFSTGRAGKGWVSRQVADAFVYHSLELARAIAERHNNFTELHGLRFVVPVNEKAGASRRSVAAN